MAALRINVPGQPIRYLELGPARARISSSPYLSMGGALVAESRQAKETKYQHQYKARLFVRCGSWMPLSQEPCGRREGHKTKCGTAEAVQRENARRRASHAVERGQVPQIVENASPNPWMRLGDKTLADSAKEPR